MLAVKYSNDLAFPIALPSHNNRGSIPSSDDARARTQPQLRRTWEWACLTAAAKRG